MQSHDRGQTSIILDLADECCPHDCKVGLSSSSGNVETEPHCFTCRSSRLGHRRRYIDSPTAHQDRMRDDSCRTLLDVIHAMLSNLCLLSKFVKVTCAGEDLIKAAAGLASRSYACEGACGVKRSERFAELSNERLLQHVLPVKSIRITLSE